MRSGVGAHPAEVLENIVDADLPAVEVAVAGGVAGEVTDRVVSVRLRREPVGEGSGL